MTERHAHLGVRRRWVKLWTQQTLHGTTSEELEPAERWVWCGFLCLAGDSPRPGLICVAHGVPYTDQQLALILKIDLRLLASAMHKMKTHGKITVNGEGIRICNWEHYQADYVRKQQQREREKAVSNVTPNAGVSNATPPPEEEEEED
jgi:hypothetical protein